MKNQSKTELSLEVKDKLSKIANKLGLKPINEYSIGIGYIDQVWLVDFGSKLPYLGSKLPVVGFEIETSWRTRKHIKGDIFNLAMLNPAVGIIIFIRKGFDDEKDFESDVNATQRNIECSKGLGRFLVWSEKHVDKLYESVIGDST